jgi:hypothetical protein
MAYDPAQEIAAAEKEREARINRRKATANVEYRKAQALEEISDDLLLLRAEIRIFRELYSLANEVP